MRNMIFSNNGKYVLSSGVGERYVAIWKLGSGKSQSSSCILSMEHPAIFVDCMCSGTNATEGEIDVLAISEVGICYFWSGNNMDDLRNKKPTKIALSESSLSRTNQDFTIFAAKLQGIDGPNSAHVLLAYGSVVKPSFDKLLVCYGKDVNLGVSEDGVLLPTVQPTMHQKGQSAKTKGMLMFISYGGNSPYVLFIYMNIRMGQPFKPCLQMGILVGALLLPPSFEKVIINGESWAELCLFFCSNYHCSRPRECRRCHSSSSEASYTRKEKETWCNKTEWRQTCD